MRSLIIKIKSLFNPKPVADFNLIIGDGKTVTLTSCDM